MLRLNRLTDYAIVVLGALAYRRCDVMPTAQLATLTGLNQPTVAKVAKLLQGAGLLETRRGASGGYRLLAAPQDISLVDIVEAVEGPIAVNGCVDGAQDPCAVSNCCFMSNHWNKVNGAVGLRYRMSAWLIWLIRPHCLPRGYIQQLHHYRPITGSATDRTSRYGGDDRNH